MMESPKTWEISPWRSWSSGPMTNGLVHRADQMDHPARATTSAGGDDAAGGVAAAAQGEMRREVRHPHPEALPARKPRGYIELVFVKVAPLV